MKSIYLIGTLLPVAAIAGMFLSSCSEDPTTQPPGGVDTLVVPTAYTFSSRFTSGASSVSYEGQVVRNMLAQDLKSAIDNLAKSGAVPVTPADLLKYYEHSDAANLTTLTTAGSLPVLEAQYNKIATGKKLSDKISPAVVIGTGKTADQLIREWLQIVADNSNDPSKLGTPAVYTDAEGRNLSQMINKLLHGAVAYYQGTGVYLSGLLDKDNSAAQAKSAGGTETFTSMEHSWDEAFGYWGAARDYARYTDAQLAGATADYVFDSNGDGKIDLRSEYNYTFARNAGKRDKDAIGVDLSKTTFDAFLRGRALIAAQGTSEAITAQRTIVASNWEKNLASTIVHYINEVRGDMATLTGESNASTSHTMNGHWGEMKGFAMALQYNPFKLITDADLTQLHMLLGSAPVYAAAGASENTEYIAKLDQAKAILKAAYSFSDTNMSTW